MNLILPSFIALLLVRIWIKSDGHIHLWFLFLSSLVCKFHCRVGNYIYILSPFFLMATFKILSFQRTGESLPSRLTQLTFKKSSRQCSGKNPGNGVSILGFVSQLCHCVTFSGSLDLTGSQFSINKLRRKTVFTPSETHDDQVRYWYKSTL